MTTSTNTLLVTSTHVQAPQPPNHGRKWSREDDAQINESADFDDDHLALSLGRSAHAVQSRRAVLAARLHVSSGRSVDECAEQLGADAARTAAIVAQENEDGGARKANGRVVEKKRILKPTKAAHDSRHTPKTFTSRAPPPTAANIRRSTPASPIDIICGVIKASGGRGWTDELWTQEALVPTLVQYHSGFWAYAAFVKGGKGAKPL